MDLRGKIFAVDLDGTLCNEQCWTPEEIAVSTVNHRIAEKVEEAFRHGFVVIYTARRDENIPVTLKWLRQNNIRYHAFSNIKIPADCYLDDKAINVNDI